MGILVRPKGIPGKIKHTAVKKEYVSVRRTWAYAKIEFGLTAFIELLDMSAENCYVTLLASCDKSGIQRFQRSRALSRAQMQHAEFGVWFICAWSYSPSRGQKLPSPRCALLVVSAVKSWSGDVDVGSSDSD